MVSLGSVYQVMLSLCAAEQNVMSEEEEEN